MKSKLLNRNFYIMILSLLIVGCLILIPVFRYNTGLETILNKGWYFFKDKVHIVEEPIHSVKSLSLSELFGMSETDDSVPSEPIGYLRVKSTHANIRTTPEVPADDDSNIYGQVEQGVNIPYYGEEINEENGRIWYRLLNLDNGNDYWISEITVEIVE